MFEELVEVPDRQLDALREAERAASVVFVRQCQALLAVWDSTPDSGWVGRRAHALAEVGLALGLHELTVGSRLGVALALQRFPLLSTSLTEGRLGVPHALVAVAELEALGDAKVALPGGETAELAGLMLTEVLAASGRIGWDGTPSQLRVALRRAAIRLDPAGAAARRAEQVAARTGLRLSPAADGLADWTATGPSAQLVAADRLLDTLAGPVGPDDSRTRGQRQIDALLGALVAKAGTGAALELQLEVPVRVGVANVLPTGLPEPVVLRADLSGDLLARLGDAARVCEPAPDRENARGVAAVRDTGATPADVAATQPVAAGRGAATASGRRRRPRGGVPELVGCGPIDPGLLREMLTDPAGLPVGLAGIRIRRLLVDRTGQVVAADARPAPLDALSASSDSGEAQPAARLLTQVTANLPPPPPRTDAYTPTAPQARVVQARDLQCCHPGCGRRARVCDLDHRLRWPEGPTSTANLHPLCRRHHRLKHDGWTCTRHPDGTTTWTTPRGQHHRDEPP